MYAWVSQFETAVAEDIGIDAIMSVFSSCSEASLCWSCGENKLPNGWKRLLEGFMCGRASTLAGFSSFSTELENQPTSVGALTPTN